MLKKAKTLACSSTAEKPPAGCPLEISELLLQAEVDICQDRKPAVLAMLASSSHLLPSDHLLKYTPPNSTPELALGERPVRTYALMTERGTAGGVQVRDDDGGRRPAVLRRWRKGRVHARAQETGG
jgi:hypothetical protein